jgi:hypothetical protein
MALTVAFVRHRERRDRIYVTRQDGTSIFWDFPSYGDRLPHDLIHLVVEDGLGIVNSFWGMVDAGADVTLIDNQATLVRHGRPLVEQPGVDFSDLMQAEEAVALLGPTGMRTEQVGAITVARLDSASSGTPPENLLGSDLGCEPLAQRSAQEIASIRQRLHDLGQQWRDLFDGAAITLTFAGPVQHPPGPQTPSRGGR